MRAGWIVKSADAACGQRQIREARRGAAAFQRSCRTQGREITLHAGEIAGGEIGAKKSGTTFQSSRPFEARCGIAAAILALNIERVLPPTLKKRLWPPAPSGGP